MTEPWGNVVVLSGGIGGAKLVLGLSRILDDARLTVIANTGDDFEHLGLRISPDLDTLMYTLGDVVNPETGWGRDNETWNFMTALEKLGGETWFRLGDRDLATHIERTRRLDDGESLTDVTAALCDRFAIKARVLPMSDDVVRTRVVTDSGALDFQHYFVRDRAEPVVTSLEYVGADEAAASPATLSALDRSDLEAIIIAPSNPYLSIAPILAIRPIHEAIRRARAPVIAVSPIIGGRAIKGPTAKMMAELGEDPSAPGVARHYGDLLDGFILDSTDGNMVEQLESEGIAATSCDTLMTSLEDKVRVARSSLEFARSLARSS